MYCNACLASFETAETVRLLLHLCSVVVTHPEKIFLRLEETAITKALAPMKPAQAPLGLQTVSMLRFSAAKLLCNLFFCPNTHSLTQGCTRFFLPLTQHYYFLLSCSLFFNYLLLICLFVLYRPYVACKAYQAYIQTDIETGVFKG